MNTDLIDPAEVSSLDDLLDERWDGRAGLARPLTGTTLTHMAALFDVWGDERTLRFLRRAFGSSSGEPLASWIFRTSG